MKKLSIKWDSEKALSLSAMFISFITLLIFIYQTNLMRRQNYISILPYLQISTSNNVGEFSYELNLKNHGVGPAIIEKVTMRHRGEEYDLADYENDVFTYLRAIAPELDSVTHYSNSTLNRGIAIPANSTYMVFRVYESEKDYRMIRESIGRLMSEGLDFELRFKSIQDEHWVIRPDSDGPERVE
jgi:hypothetical protein